MHLHRRETLGAALAAGLACTLPAGADESEQEPSLTGEAVAELGRFDDWLRGFLAKHKVPGGQLAAMRGGQLIYSRGCGWADRDEKTPVEPQSLFRIASVSKPITAVAILRLVQQQKVKLSDKLDDILKIEPHVEKDAKLDERSRNITIEHCLTHSGGWDREASYDPMFAYSRVAKSLEMKLPVGTGEIIRYMRGQPLDFKPGEKYAYSNFGYCLLGRVIEKLSGDGYEKFVQREVFAPLGITAPRIGASLAAGRAEREVKYYTISDEQVTPSVGPHAGDEQHPVPLSYGGWNQEALDAHGGWIASCEDLVKFAAAFDDAALRSSKPLLSAALAEQMLAPHIPTSRNNQSTHYGLGWIHWAPDADRIVHSHGGTLPCTAAILVKLPGDINIAALFNLGQNKSGAFIGRGLDAQVFELAQSIEKCPEK